MSTLVFDEGAHSYAVDGRKVPGVTSLLAPLVDYSMISREVMERAQQLGTAVHRMTELHDNDDLDEDSLSDELRPYLDGWKKFRAECQFEPITIEKKLYHPMFRYAGTSDRTGMVKGRLAVIDIKKMMTLGPVIGVQLAAYQELHKADGLAVVDRYALGLRPDGSYRLQPYRDMLDWQCFLSLLTQRNWSIKNGNR
ncbi:hypothetical protein [Paraburkholderia sp.]|uniref:hypothetical protein n=1 Tax=Paraburkholderia sp. TaxID=1926495 RepID=UPI003C7DD906